MPAPQAQALWTQTVTAAEHALKSNQLADAVELAEAAITQSRGFGPHDTHLARSLVLRAEICLWQKETDRAEALFQKAVTACETAVGPRSRELVYPLSSLANFYTYVVPQRQRVAVLFKRILAIVEQAPDRDEHDVLLWSRNLGLLYSEMGDCARAEPYYVRALALAAKVDPNYVTHEQLGAAAFYRHWRHFDHALALANSALAARERALAAAPRDVDAKLDVAVALDELGAIHLAAGQLSAAEAACRRSLALVDSFMPPDQPDLQPRIAALAAVYRAEQQPRLAAAEYQRLLRLTEKNLGPDSSDTATVLLDYAAVLRELRQPNEAASLQARADSIHRQLASSP